MPSDQLSDLIISSSHAINSTIHKLCHHQWCLRSLPLAKVKDSSHIMEVNFSSPIYDIGPSLPQEKTRTLGSTHRRRSFCINSSSITCASHADQRKDRDPHQDQWWEHQGLRRLACHLHHWQDHPSCELPRCQHVKNPIIGLDAIHHNRFQVHLWKAHPSAASTQRTSSLSSMSLLCLSFGSSRSCSKSSSSQGRPSVRNFGQPISIQDHFRN